MVKRFVKYVLFHLLCGATAYLLMQHHWIRGGAGGRPWTQGVRAIALVVSGVGGPMALAAIILLHAVELVESWDGPAAW